LDTAFFTGAARLGLASLAGATARVVFFTVLVTAFLAGVVFTGLAAREAFEALGISHPLTKGAGG
jgi:hypothetical protein